MATHPEWAFVSVVLAADKETKPRVFQAPGFVGSGKDTAICVFCGKTFSGLVDRIRNHVAGCAAGGLAGIAPCQGPRALAGEPPEAFAERTAQFAAARAKCANKNAELRAAALAQTRKHSLDKATAPESYVPSGAKPRPQKQLRLDENSAKNLKATVDLARGFYSAGIAPHVLTNKLLRRGLLSVAAAGADWRPPSADEVLGPLLNQEHARVKAAITGLQGSASRVGNTLVGDGATNVNRQPILNVLFVRGNRVEFVKAQDCSGHVKNGRFIADDVIDVIKALDDPQSVVLVLMDNATRSAWPLIEAACPWVVCGPCGPHVADLLLEDVGKLSFFKALFAKAQTLRVFVRGHTHVLAAYRDVMKSELSNTGATRFCTNVIGLKNVAANREALVSTFGAPAVLTAMDKVKGDKLTEGEHGTVGQLFAHLQRQVMSSDFWNEVAWASAIMLPMSKLLRFMEQDAPTASKVYHAWFLVQSAIEELEGVPDDLKKEILACVAHRWDYGYHMIHGVGYVLDPEFRRLCEPPDECKESFNQFVLKCYPEPERASFATVEAYAKARDEHTELIATIDRQLLEYRRGDGIWGRPAVVHNAKLVSAVDFWDMYGSMPLQRVALRALGCAAGACAAERGHKEMNFIQSDVRNRLGWLKAEKLMYLRINLDILNRDIDHSSISNPMFQLDAADMEELELPSAWRDGGGRRGGGGDALCRHRPLLGPRRQARRQQGRCGAERADRRAAGASGC